MSLTLFQNWETEQVTVLCPEALNEIILPHITKQHMLVIVIKVWNNLVETFTWTPVAINMAKWEYP